MKTGFFDIEVVPETRSASMRVACLWFLKSVPTSKLAELFLRLSPQIAIRGERALFIEIGKSMSLYSESSLLQGPASS